MMSNLISVVTYVTLFGSVGFSFCRRLAKLFGN